MRKNALVKGYLIKPIMEILKKDYKIKSPSPSNLFVEEDNGEFKVYFKNSSLNIDFSNMNIIKDLLLDIKSNVLYGKV